MITVENIRPIPKYMLERIQKLDKERNEKPSPTDRFYTYFTKYKNELCSVTVAVRNKYKKWYCKQVVVHGIHSTDVCLRDIALYMGFIKVGWYRDGLTKEIKYHDYDWGYNYDRCFQMNTATVVNKEYISSLPEYKYSAIDKYLFSDVFKYLRLYEKYPQAELLVKAGLSRYATSKQILEKCKKDKKFCKWLYRNKEDLSINYYYIPTILTAYKQNKPLKQTQKYLDFKKRFANKDNFRTLKAEFKEDKNELLDYLIKQNTDGYCYTDYLNACNYLGLNMKEEKNRFPHNFQYWHDMRIDQYHTQKALKDEQEKKALYENFGKIANKYMSLQRTLKKDDYVCLIALNPNQLVYEGKQLNHCVGRMNYDQKFAREETLIFFIRNKLAPNTPFVTLEYSLKTKKVLQCYGDRDTKPADEVLFYVNNVWLPHANRKLRAIA